MNIETANRLYQFRKSHNLSQEELANKIGVSRQAVSKWERAEASPDTDNLILLSKIYGVTLDDLLKENDVVGTSQGESISEDACDNNNSQSNQQSANTENTTADEYNNNYSNSTSGTAGTNYVKKDKISFKDGIHIDAKNGDKVDIGFNGVHVHDHKGTKVNIDGSGVFVQENDGTQKVYTDSNGNVYYDENMEHHQCEKKSVWHLIPYPIIITILFLAWGFAGGWAISWILFLTIPLYYTLVDAIIKKKPSHFAYPVLVTAVFLWTGLTMGLWHPMWLVFLTIPVYYCICDMIKKLKQ